MPFTVSHAAAVLPFRRARLPWSALVIGSFGPDLEYFLRMYFLSRQWHFFPDVFLYCLPFCIFTYFLFHAVLKEPFITLLPEGIQQRLHPDHDPYPHDLRGWLLLILATLIGIATHLVWDSFTHAYTWPWRHIRALRKIIRLRPHEWLTGYGIAQNISSVVGLLILFAFGYWWYRTRRPDHPAVALISHRAKVALWTVFLTVPPVLAWGRCYAIMGIPRDHIARDQFHVLFVISTISLFLWEVLGFSVIMTLRKRKAAHL